MLLLYDERLDAEQLGGVHVRPQLALLSGRHLQRVQHRLGLVELDEGEAFDGLKKKITSYELRPLVTRNWDLYYKTFYGHNSRIFVIS